MKGLLSTKAECFSGWKRKNNKTILFKSNLGAARMLFCRAILKPERELFSNRTLIYLNHGSERNDLFICFPYIDLTCSIRLNFVCECE